ncbi:GNAT family N-acetyltransferase [Azospirillum rugosum]|uniref:ElaA protein n=1 Tax=Azospirillum rugosum TaxID=416170 RepID=A0ABS4SPV3_9PROT|nr:GNAT family N-acetyltransferase [Azospirillum rugosum]MBP2294587.1 ElaA protein [Azospirillum rugosum]MDQ0528124.1 ElaA protein [Azospirillum rugosum]
MQSRWSRFDELPLADFYAMLHLRQSVLIVEQASPYPDLDGRDPEAWHLGLYDGETVAPVGYARIFGPDPATGTTSFGRLAVAPAWRGKALGRRLVSECLDRLAREWPEHDVLISAQLYLENFYGSFGLRRVSDIYDDVGIDHIDMRLTRG